MKRYCDTGEIKNHFTDLKPISSSEAFQFYKYTAKEYNKWMERWKDEKVVNDHFSHYEGLFNKRDWSFGSVQLSSLYPLTMCIGPDFLKRLACSKTTCPEFYKEDYCCSDPEEMQTPTLEKVITNFGLNSHTKAAKDILEKLNKKGRIDLLTVVIMTDKEPPYLPHVIDGNHRLIAMGISSNMSKNLISCYIGG